MRAIFAALLFTACTAASGTDAGIPGDAPFDGGGDTGPLAAGCDGYCAAVTSACTGASAQYADLAACLAFCGTAGWPEGDPGASRGNTIQCRIGHAGAAASDPTQCAAAGPTGGGICGGGGDFRADPSSAFVRVDRVGAPGVSLFLVPPARAEAYNDGSPPDDTAGTFAADLEAGLASLHALDADLAARALTACASAPPAPGALPPCFAQEITPGLRVADLLVPDALRLDPAAPSGFPNGRRPDDAAMARVLALLLLELGGTCGAGTCDAATFEAMPLGPPANDVPFSATFPYLAPPHAP